MGRVFAAAVSAAIALIGTASGLPTVQRAPERFAGRVGDGIVAQYSFQQAHCAGGVFASDMAAAEDDVLGAASMDTANWGAGEIKSLRCPLVEREVDLPFSGLTSLSHHFASNGASFGGQRQPALTRDESIMTANSIEDLGLTDAMTIEMWIRPDFSSTASGGTKEHVLFEIGQSTIPENGASGFTWTCAGDNFAARLTYDDTAENQQFKFEYKIPGQSTCRSHPFGVALEAGTLYHLIVVFNSVTRTGVSVFLNNVQAGFEEGFGGLTDLSQWTSTHKVRFGSDPIVISNANPSPGGYYSWHGDIFLAAIYNRALSEEEIAANFAAKLPNSVPIPANEVILAPGAKEDEIAALNLAELAPSVYDFDAVVLGDAADLSFFLGSNATDVTTVDGAVAGDLLEDGEVVLIDDEFAALSFGATALNEYGGPARFLFHAADGVEPLKVFESAKGTVDAVVAPTNDAPKLTARIDDGNVPVTGLPAVSQTRSVLLTLAVDEVDCSKVQDSAAFDEGPSSCALFGLASFSLTSDPTFGRFFFANKLEGDQATSEVCKGGEGRNKCKCMPLSASTEFVEFNDNNTVTWGTDLRAESGVKAITICFAGCFGKEDDPNVLNPCPADVSQDDDGIVGRDQFSLKVEDVTGATASRDFEITIAGVLQVGGEGQVQEHFSFEVPSSSEEEDFSENEGWIPITLRGLDLLCEDESGPLPAEDSDPSCVERFKTFVIKELPRPGQGSLYEREGDEDSVIALDAGSEYALPQNQTTVWFRPTQNFFNRDSWPLCARNLGTFGQCGKAQVKDDEDDKSNVKLPNQFPYGYPGESDDISNWSVVPSGRYERFTTVDLSGKLFGGCDETDPFVGCPVNIVYSVQVNNLKSRPNVGNQVWVTNVFDYPQLVLPVTELLDMDTNEQRLVRGPEDSGSAPVMISTNEEGDSRIMGLYVEVLESRGQLRFDTGGQLPDSLTEETLLNNCDIFVGCTKYQIFGTPKDLNTMLKNLKFIATGRQARAVIEFKLSSPGLPNSLSVADGQPNVPAASFVAEIVVKYKEAEVDTNPLRASRAILYSSISAVSLLVLGACYCLCHCIFRRALMGERAAVWFVRNVLFTSIDPAKDEERIAKGQGVNAAFSSFEKAIHDDRVRMERVQCCARLLSVICPCCCKFDPESKKNMPTEEQMKKAAISRIRQRVAAQHVPPTAELSNRTQRIVIPEDEIFDWEVHQHTDERTGQTRNYYYNPKTDVSTWFKPEIQAGGGQRPASRPQQQQQQATQKRGGRGSQQQHAPRVPPSRNNRGQGQHLLGPLDSSKI